MVSKSPSTTTKYTIDTLYQTTLDSSSVEPPMNEWSSLIFENELAYNNLKMALEGRNDTGSGEICGKYIPMSDSTVIRHVYYNYPCLKDPKIKEALLDPEPIKTYSYDGQELYLDLCLKMNVIPVRSFHRGLLNEEIDLKTLHIAPSDPKLSKAWMPDNGYKYLYTFFYYGVNPIGVRAMCLALVNNQYVKRLDLTSNYLKRDAWYHLGQLLGESIALQELVLAECKLGPEGMRLLVCRLSKPLELLDLSKNMIGDDGFQFLANQIMKGAVIKRLNLSSNDLSKDSSAIFAEALSYNNTITHLDISWNKMYSSKGTNDLLQILGSSKVFLELNYSWNALNTGPTWKVLMCSKTLQVLNLSNNRLSTRAVKAISSTLNQAEKLHTLDLSHNSLTPDDALMILETMRDENVKLKNLYMDDLSVTKEFATAYEEIILLEHRRNTIITYGKVLRNYTQISKDFREIVMKRLEYLTTKASKKCQVHIGLLILQARKKYGPIIEMRAMVRQLRYASAPIDDDLLEQLADCFPGPRSEKGGKTINLDAVIEYIHRLWPDLALPPTPPPEPVPVVIKNKKKDKINKKKK